MVQHYQNYVYHDKTIGMYTCYAGARSRELVVGVNALDLRLNRRTGRFIVREAQLLADDGDFAARITIDRDVNLQPDDSLMHTDPVCTFVYDAFRKFSMASEGEFKYLLQPDQVMQTNFSGTGEELVDIQSLH